MEPRISRRVFLAAAALAGCAKKARGFHGYAFVANQEGRSIAAVDLSAFTLARQIALDARPAEIVAHERRRRVYALAPENGTIYEIDTGSLALKHRARVAQRAVSMRLADDAQSLWLLARDPRELIRVPLDSLRPADRIRLPHDPGNFELGRRDDRPLAAVSFPAEGAAALCDLSARSVTATVDLGCETRIGGFRKDGRHLLAGNGAERLVTIVDVKTAKIVVRLPLPLEPANFCFLPDGGQLFVTGPGRDAVVIVEPFGTQVGETMLAGSAPAAMASYVTANTSYLFVCNPESGDVTILDIDTRKLVVVVHVGIEPRQVLFTPDNQYALVLNSGSGDMAVIRIRQFTTGPGAQWAQRNKRAGVFMMVPVGARPVGAAVVGV